MSAATVLCAAGLCECLTTWLQSSTYNVIDQHFVLEAHLVLRSSCCGMRHADVCQPSSAVQACSNVKELITPPLDGTILPGVTRDSILQLTRDWEEFEVSERQLSIQEIKQVRSQHMPLLALTAFHPMSQAVHGRTHQQWQNACKLSVVAPVTKAVGQTSA